jgi:DME family drug/metabolite transporter
VSAGADLWGILGSLGAGASFALFANAQRMLIVDGWSPFTAIGGMGAVAAVLSVLLIPFVDLSWLALPGGWAMGLWLGLATTAAAYVLFIAGLRRLTAATTATLTLGEPLTASLLGIVVLGERLAPLSLVGLAVLTVALIVLAWSSRSPAIRTRSRWISEATDLTPGRSWPRRKWQRPPRHR